MKQREPYELIRLHDGQVVDRADMTDDEAERANVRLATVTARVWGEPEHEWRPAETTMGASAAMPQGWMP